MKINDLFELSQGNGFDLQSMGVKEQSDIYFVSRTAADNGVVANVERIEAVEPFPAGLITVALGGSVLSTFVQRKPFYTSYHVMVLKPKTEMTLNEKLYWCMCINANAYRYNYGRQANKTLAKISLPDRLPDYISKVAIKPISTQVRKSTVKLETQQWKTFQLNEIFEVSYGNKLDAQNTTHFEPTVNYVSRASYHNGVVDKVDLVEGVKPYPSGCITVSLGGSYLGATFVQNKCFYTGQNVAVLKCKEPISLYAKLFICQIIRFEANGRFRAFGRELNTHIKTNFPIKLPVGIDGKPDYSFMENYIKKIPYSDRI